MTLKAKRYPIDPKKRDFHAELIEKYHFVQELSQLALRG